MTRLLKTLPLVLLVVAAVACGSSSSSSSLSSDDVAVVNGQHITKAQLDEQIALVVASAKAQHQTVPKAGSTDYKQKVIQPSLQQLVQNAEFEMIASDMKLSVSDAEVTKAVDSLVKQNYAGDHSKFVADLKNYGFTPAQFNAVAHNRLLQNKVVTSVRNGLTLTPAQLKAKYDKNPQTFGDARDVHYMLWASKAKADAALAKLNSGVAETKAATGSIDADTTHGNAGFTAASGAGLMDANFQKAAFQLPNGAWGQPVEANPDYAKTNLAGQCKPKCYFLINPISDALKAGTDATYAKLKAMVAGKYNPASQTVDTEVNSKIVALLDPFKKKTEYATGYAPPAALTSPTTTSSTGATT